MNFEPSKLDRGFARLAEWLRREQGGVSMNDAADRLELSRIRIAQLTAEGMLTMTKFESIVIISRRSLEDYAVIMAQRPFHKKGPGYRRPSSRPRYANWAAKFLKALREGESIVNAAGSARVGRQTVYALRARDDHFAAAWDACLAQGRAKK